MGTVPGLLCTLLFVSLEKKVNLSYILYINVYITQKLIKSDIKQIISLQKPLWKKKQYALSEPIIVIYKLTIYNSQC